MQNLSIGISDSVAALTRPFDPSPCVDPISLISADGAEDRGNAKRGTIYLRRSVLTISTKMCPNNCGELEIRLIPHCLRGASSLVLLNSDLSATLVSVARAICNVELHAHAACPVTRVVVGHRGIFKLASAVRRSESVLGTGPMQRPGLPTPDSRLPTPDSRFWKSGADSTPDSRLGVPRRGVHAHRPRACSQCHSGTAVAWAAPAPGEPTGNVR